jgi:hypothetical protein
MLPPKSTLTHNFFTPQRTTDIDTTENTDAENTLPEQEAATNNDDFYHKPHSTPEQLKRPCQRRGRVPKYTKKNPYHNKRNGRLFSHEILPGEK